jgi:hypothetical protein
MLDKPENFSTCFIEHLQPFHNNSYNSNFLKHLLENQHPIDTIDKIVEILYTTGKGGVAHAILSPFSELSHGKWDR